MDADLTRLLAIEGIHDLSLVEVAEVLKLDERTVRRCTAKMDEQPTAGVPKLQAKRYQIRGKSSRRVRYPRGAVVRYIVEITTGDKSAILAAIAAQCPQYLPAAQGIKADAPAPAPLPANVVSIEEGKKPRVKRLPIDPLADHPRLFA